MSLFSLRLSSFIFCLLGVCFNFITKVHANDFQNYNREQGLSQATIQSLLIDKIEIIEVDLLDRPSLENIPEDIDGAYYLVHSMSTSSNYKKLEEESASNEDA